MQKLGVIELVDDDDLAALVVPAVEANVMRQLHGTATGARGLGRSADLHVCRAAGMSLRTALLLLRYWHVDLSLLTLPGGVYAQRPMIAQGKTL